MATRAPNPGAAGGTPHSPSTEARAALARDRHARVALVGTGHIGGSLALALREAGLAGRIIGCDRDPASASRALERGIVDEIAATPVEAARGADLCILATPVGATAEVAAALGPALGPGCLVLDVGSTKGRVVAAVEGALPLPGRFVGSHPIAGTERSGPDAASADLFRGRRVLLTPTETTWPEAIAAAGALWSAVGARVGRIAPGLHDEVLGAVSHLPHVAAFTLAAAIDRLLDGDPALGAAAAGLAGGGFIDTTPIAASDPTMWRDIFLDNRGPLLGYTAALADELGALRGALERGDGPALVALVERARRGRARVVPPSAPAPAAPPAPERP